MTLSAPKPPADFTRAANMFGMDPKIQERQAERNQTDESLRIERENTDEAIADGRKGLEERVADQVVERAREQADAVLETARDAADQDASKPAAQGRDNIATQRALEDKGLEEARSAADETLRRERAEAARILATLLPIERAKTDRFLLTERARSDDALAHRDDFLGMVSHDLRDLLNGILLNATVLSDGDPEPDSDLRAGVKRIQRYAARMNSLIGDLLDVVSIDVGKLAIRPARRDAVALITEAVDAFTLAASEKGITLECGIGDRPLLADFDYERMLQVIVNLVANALKFTPRGGKVTVHGECAGRELRLSVRDTGAGIPDDQLEAVFERFWQVGKNHKKGLGLGLYISKSIVEAHRGRIWVESKPAEGSTFHVVIPLS